MGVKHNRSNVTAFTVSVSMLYSGICLVSVILIQRHTHMAMTDELDHLSRMYSQLRVFGNNPDDGSYPYRVEAFLNSCGALINKYSGADGAGRRHAGARRTMSSGPSSAENGGSDETDVNCCAPYLHRLLPQWNPKEHTLYLMSSATRVAPKPAESDSKLQGTFPRKSSKASKADGSTPTLGGGAPSIVLSSVLKGGRAGMTILSTIVEEPDDSDSEGEDERSEKGEGAPEKSTTADWIEEGEVVIKVKQMSSTQVLVRSQTRVDGNLRTQAIMYSAVDENQQAEPGQAEEVSEQDLER